MPKFKIGGSYGYVGTDWEDFIEVDDVEAAEDWAKDHALERVEWWAEPFEEADDQEEAVEE